MSTPKPVSAVQTRLGSIPKELKQYDRWILWKYTQLPNGKWTKTPHSALNGRKIDATNFDNGSDFRTAVQAMRGQRTKFDGLGFLLGDGIAGIDVDDCIDEDGNLDDRGQRLSQAYAGTYAEISPSGRGFKVMVRIGDDPKLASIGKNKGGIEIYGGRRYFTVTGAMLPGHTATVAHMAEAFRQTADEIGVKPADGPRDITQDKERSGFDYATARQMLDNLPFRWCDEYGDWLRTGMALHHEFGGAVEALELWDEWSQRSVDKYDPEACATKWATFGRPGKDNVTIRTLVREAQAHGWRPPSTIARAIEDFSVLEDPAEQDPETGVVTDGDWWSQHSVGDMLRTQPLPLKWLWKGLLLESKVLVLAGSGGSSKSYLMLAAAVQYAMGQPWGPFDLSPEHDGRVLLLYGEEDHQDVHHRLFSLQQNFMLDDEQVQRVSERMAVLPLRGKDVVLMEYGESDREVVVTQATRKLEARIKQYGVKLLVLDPMALLHGLEENDNNAISHFVRELDAVCMRTGCSIVLVHHFSKVVARAREINESNVRGASALVAHARTVVIMHRLRRDEAGEWGVPEEDHGRWTMFNVVKNNYGPTGAVHWFNVNQANGVITPSQTQLTFMNSRDIRMALLAQQESEQREQDAELTAREEQRAREEAMKRISQQTFMRTLLTHAIREGTLPTYGNALEILQHTHPQMIELISANRVRAVYKFMQDEGYIVTENRQFRITDAGRQWHEDSEILE